VYKAVPKLRQNNGIVFGDNGGTRSRQPRSEIVVKTAGSAGRVSRFDVRRRLSPVIGTPSSAVERRCL